MRTVFILVLFMAGILDVRAQAKGTAKLYAYRQAVAPGVSKGTIDINGEEVGNGGEARQNQWLYLRAGTTVYPSLIYIDGATYSARAKRIAATPVTVSTATGKKELVPRTSQRTWQLTPAPAIEGKSMAKAESLAKENAVVVVYKQAGKFYYVAMKNWKELEDAQMQ